MAYNVGNSIQTDYFDLVGGINNTDSPLKTEATQCSQRSRNFEYIRTGGVKKTLGIDQINSVADTELRTTGLFLRETKTNVQNVIRTAGRKVQQFNVTSGAFTNLTEDTSTASSDVLAASNTDPTSAKMFSTPSSDILWFAGGGLTSVYGVYNSTKVTENGSETPTGSLGQSVGGSGGSFAITGTLYYAVALRKASTQAISNADLDVEVTISATTDEVNISFTSLGSIDTTKYDRIYLYRSAFGGASGFTTGDLVAAVNSTATSYTDLGVTAGGDINIPRANSTVLDNSTLPSGDYDYVTTFKRRLIAVAGNTVYISDINKPESWPTVQRFDLPSGGEVTGLGVISFNTPTTSDIDEFLMIFKRDELRILTGTGAITAGIPDWELKYISGEGCISHASIVNAGGYIWWLGTDGINMWDGSSKPTRVSNLLQAYFETDGDLTLSQLESSWGVFYKSRNQVVWAVSHDTYGVNKYFLKLDLKLTSPVLRSDFSGRVANGVFMARTIDTSMYAGLVYSDTAQVERYLVGDAAGFVYQEGISASDAGAGIEFNYDTLFLDQNKPGKPKHYKQVIAWVDQVGAWDLQLDYWTDYRSSEFDKSSRAVKVGPGQDSPLALWDVAFWDQAFWDDYEPKLVPLVFNLSSEKNNSQGSSIKLRFKNENSSEPITINGFSIIYDESDGGLRT